MSKPAKQRIKELIEEHGLPKPTTEFIFHPERKWRFDYCWEDRKIALELEGGAFIRGRHTRPKGFTEDIVKYNEAQKCGWMVFRVTSEQVKSGYCLELLKSIFVMGDL
jgi:very-short-patch-repair endonuclease